MTGRLFPQILVIGYLLWIWGLPTFALSWPGDPSEWNGHPRVDFVVDGRPCHVVIPNRPAPGKPWVWRARFPSYHTEAGIPLLHVVSLNDQIVPPTENTFVLAERYRELGGNIEIMEVQEGTTGSGGHHFTHPDPQRTASFIRRHAWADRAQGDSSRGSLLLACEQAGHRVLLLDAGREWDASAVCWQWSAAEDPHIAENHRAWFGNPSDAKGVARGQRIVTVASGGGVALIDVQTRRAMTYGYAGGNPHSAALLPDGSIVTASSTADRVQLFPTPPAGTRLLEATQAHLLSDAHGVVWDDARKCVWALGGKAIMQFDYDLKAGELQLTQTVPLPVNEYTLRHSRHGGHDLAWQTGPDTLMLSDMEHVWTFDPTTAVFSPLPPHDLPGVKSLSQGSGQPSVIVMQATESWWSDTVRSLDGAWRRTLPGAQFYKVRWWEGPVPDGMDRTAEE